MPFFDDVDALGIGELHIQKLQGLEEGTAKKLLKRYKGIRGELRDRLDTLRGDTFSAQQLRGTLYQIETAIDEMGSSLLEQITDAARDFVGLGTDDLLSEINAFDEEFTGAVVPINVDAAAVLEDTQNLLINRYQASLEAYSSDLRAKIAEQLTQAVIAQIPLDKVIRGMSQFFMGEEWKLLRIARTELHNVYGVAKLNGMRRLADGSVPDMMKALLHPLDARTGKDSIKLAKINPVIPVDEPFRYKWAGKERVFMTPPDRPNDRAILIPYRPAWGPVGNDSAFVPGS